MRSRNIKPGFFQNPDLIELEPITRLLFAGLWCVADRDGRLEDRPKYIKVQLLPGDNCDVCAMLSSLQKAGFIQRYEYLGSKYIQITNFSKHQNPHKQEKKSTIQAPCIVGTKSEQAPDGFGVASESVGLIPDSLIPDSKPLADKSADDDLAQKKSAWHAEQKKRKAAELKSRLAESFDAIYADYPRKEKSKEAKRHYLASVKTEQDLVKIDLALTAYLKLVEGKERQHIQTAATWFNNWQDYIPANWQEVYDEWKKENEDENNQREED